MLKLSIGGINLRERILAVAKAILGNDVNEMTNMNILPIWDSLKTLQIIMTLDEEGITIPLEKIATVKSIDDLINFANK